MDCSRFFEPQLAQLLRYTDRRMMSNRPALENDCTDAVDAPPNGIACEPVAVWYRSCSVICSKGDEPWAQSERLLTVVEIHRPTRVEQPPIMPTFLRGAKSYPLTQAAEYIVLFSMPEGPETA